MNALSVVLGLILAVAAEAREPVIADISILEKAGAKILNRDSQLGLAFGLASRAEQKRISQLAHEEGRCGGFELISPKEAKRPELLLKNLKVRIQAETSWLGGVLALERREAVAEALKLLEEDNIRSTVEWLSSFPSRSARQSEPNSHVNELEGRVKTLLAAYPGSWKVEQVEHARTKQRTLKVRLEGKTRPEEIIVLGGHLDSISGMFGSGQSAPGADDNASGSANLLETLRVLAAQGVPERTVEFFWYAGEELGLIGSGEIAEKYKTEGRDVIAVLQLDMTLFPGSGEFVIGNITDYTSAWLREYLENINNIYLGLSLVPDKCGYACSDHASWFRRGFPTLMPFEAKTSQMNRKIHTDKDKIDSSSSFRHSLSFAKIALVFAMDLANSTKRQPY